MRADVWRCLKSGLVKALVSSTMGQGEEGEREWKR